MKNIIPKFHKKVNKQINTAQNMFFSPNFPVSRFYARRQFPPSFGQVASKSVGTVHSGKKLSQQSNQVKLWYIHVKKNTKIMFANNFLCCKFKNFLKMILEIFYFLYLNKTYIWLVNFTKPAYTDFTIPLSDFSFKGAQRFLRFVLLW